MFSGSRQQLLRHIFALLIFNRFPLAPSTSLSRDYQLIQAKSPYLLILYLNFTKIHSEKLRILNGGVGGVGVRASHLTVTHPRERKGFSMTCHIQEDGGIFGRRDPPSFVYNACSLGYLVTLLSISNRRSRNREPGPRRALPAKLASEPGSEGRGTGTHREEREESNSSMGEMS